MGIFGLLVWDESPMLKIALTGGIGSGKTTVSDYFRKLGVPVIDADETSHEVTQAGAPAVQKIVDVFGDSVLDRDGNLDRTALRNIVFGDTESRKQLESILHPEIRRRMNDAASRTQSPYCLFSIPLLIETSQHTSYDRILVVETSEDRRRTWIQARSDLTEGEITAILSAQVSDEQRRGAADDLLINDGGIDDLHARIDRLHQRYLALARGQEQSNG
jgi:dephospho-CoA kinase